MDPQIKLLSVWAKHNGLDIDHWGLQAAQFDHVRGLGTRQSISDGYYVESTQIGEHTTMRDSKGDEERGYNEAESVLGKPLGLLQVPYHLMLTSTYLVTACPAIACLARAAFEVSAPFVASEVQVAFLIDQKRLYDRAIAAHDCISQLSSESPINWMPYIQSLPDSYSTTLNWNMDQLEYLGLGTLTCTQEAMELALEGFNSIIGYEQLEKKLSLAAIGLKKQLENSFGEKSSFCINLLQRTSPLLNIALNQSVAERTSGVRVFTLNEYQWATSVIATRSVYTPAFDSLHSTTHEDEWKTKFRSLACGRDVWNALSSADVLSTNSKISQLCVENTLHEKSPYTSLELMNDLMTFALMRETNVDGREQPRYIEDLFAVPEDPATQEKRAMSRFISYSESSKEFDFLFKLKSSSSMPNQIARRDGDCALVPFLDLFNHSDKVQCDVKWLSNIMVSNYDGKKKKSSKEKDKKEKKSKKDKKVNEKEHKSNQKEKCLSEPELKEDIASEPFKAFSDGKDCGVFTLTSAPYYELSLCEGSFFPSVSTSISVTSRPIKEIFISYGNLSNLKLAMRYGFSLLPNKHDCILIDRMFVDWSLSTKPSSDPHVESKQALECSKLKSNSDDPLSSFNSFEDRAHFRAERILSVLIPTESSLRIPMDVHQRELLRACGLATGDSDSSHSASSPRNNASISSPTRHFRIDHDGLPWDLVTYLKVRVLNKRMFWNTYFESIELNGKQVSSSFSSDCHGDKRAHQLVMSGQLFSIAISELPSPSGSSLALKWASRIFLEEGFLSEEHSDLFLKARDRLLAHLSKRYSSCSKLLNEHNPDPSVDFSMFTAVQTFKGRAQLIESLLESQSL